MSAFAPSAKKAKVSAVESDFFHGIPDIKYEGPESKNPLAFRYYDANRIVAGKPMKDWLRFSVCFWHTFRGGGSDPFGFPTQIRSWDDGTSSLENALRRVRAAFAFFKKLGVEYYTFHDRDVAPEGDTPRQSEENLDKVTDLMLELQRATGVRLLWGTANLFAHPRYMNGAMTSPDLRVFACAAAQVKKAMEVTLKLGGENYVFWGGREGYMSVLNTDVKREVDHMAAFLKMAVDYKAKIGARYQLLIEPKPREPTKHQYDYDAQTVMGFLRAYGLQDHFKLNIEPNHTTLAGHDFEHDIWVASKFGGLGSIDANTGDPLLGWDTDQFPSDVKKCTLVMKAVIEQGGVAPGGLNFDCKLRRESTDLEDMFLGHIGAMDTYAHALLCAAKLIEEGPLAKLVAARYSTFDTPEGRAVESGHSSLETLAAMAAKQDEPPLSSGKQELCEAILNRYVH